MNEKTFKQFYGVMVTYMWNDQTASHQHQIVNSNLSPCSIAVRLLAHSQLSTDLSAPVKEDPNVISFLHFADPTWYICAIVEHKWDTDLSRLDSFLYNHEFLSQNLSRLCFPQQRRLCKSLGNHRNRRIRAKLLLRQTIRRRPTSRRSRM